MKEIILIKNGELALKGLNRSQFEDKMIKNIRRRLSDLGRVTFFKSQSTVTVYPEGDDFDLDEAVARVGKIFGIAAYSRAAVAPKDFEQIKAICVEYFKDNIFQYKTFKVEAKRSDKSFPLKSPEISREIGALMLQSFPFLKVDVHNPDLKITVEIRDKEVRVISDTGEQLGIMSAKEAQQLADAKGVDLVKIAPQAKPPVVKIMDYSKFRYEQSKREKENRKKQKIVETKEIRLSINIDIGDFNTKVNQARKFLSKGDKVKVSIRLRGREMAHADLAENNCMRFAEELSEEANVDKKPKLEGRQVLMFLSPKVSTK